MREVSATAARTAGPFGWGRGGHAAAPHVAATAAVVAASTESRDDAPTVDDAKPGSDAPGSGSIARGGSLNFLGSVCTALVNFALVYAISQPLGGAGAGRFLIAIAIFQILSRTAELGVSTGLVRWISRARVDGRVSEMRASYRVSLGVVVAMGVALGATTWFTAPAIAGLFTDDVDDGTIASLIRTMALFLPISALYAAVINGSRGFKSMMPTVVVDKIAKPILQLMAVAAVVFTDLDNGLLALAWTVPVALLTIPAILWSRKLLRRAEGRGRRNDQWSDPRSAGTVFREFWAFTLPRSVASIFQVAILWLDTVLVGAVLDTEAAGVYATGIRYLMVGTFLGLAVSQSIQPLIAEALADGSKGSASRLFQTGTAWLAMLTMPLYAATIVFADPLLRIFGDEYVAAAPALILLSAATIFSAACGPVDTVLLMGGKSTSSLVNMALALGANIVLNLILIPRYGITGAGVAFAVSIVISKLAPVVQVRRSLGLHPFGTGTVVVIGLCLGLFVPVIVAGRAAFGQTLPAALISGLVACGVYAAGAFRFRGPLHLNEFSGVFGRRKAQSPQEPAAA